MDFLELSTVLFCLGFLLQLLRLAFIFGRRSNGPTTLQQPTLEITDPDIAHRALIENADAFSNRPSTPFPVALVTGRRRQRSDNLSTVPYGLRWRTLRRNLTAEMLHPSRMGFLAQMQKAAINALIPDLCRLCAGGGAGELVIRGHLYTAVFALTARMCFGDDVDQRGLRASQLVMEEFVRGVGEAQAYAGSKLAMLLHWRRRRRFLGSRGRMAEAFFPLIAARRQKSNKPHCDEGIVVHSYVDSLLDLRVPDGDADTKDDDVDVRRALTDDEVVSLVSEFLGASTETVVACVEWTLAHLVNEPDVQTKLRREVDNEGESMASDKNLRDMPYLRAVVLESLRMHPPVPFLMRDLRDEAAAGVLETALPMAAGLRVHFMTGDIGRSAKVWTDPDEFRPDRFLAGGEAEDVGPLPGPKEIRMLPFGAGRRFCPGMGLAMLHIKCILAALLREFEWAPPAEVRGSKVDLTELDMMFKVMKHPLRARVKQRT
uniref:Uncharacterized protein n=1 Tax=Avena sativa TaxID=4498 RepID=A0ACD6A4V7_AVESA